MTEILNIKESIDLRQIVEQDLGQSPSRSSKAWLWKCPFHNERKGLSLAVWRDGFRCFGKCGTQGDLLDWMQTYRRLSFTDALNQLSTGSYAVTGTKVPIPALVGSPDFCWQSAAEAILIGAESNLWYPEGEQALMYLMRRGLTSATIRNARLGYIPGEPMGWREIYGFRVPCGILIPWYAQGSLWAMKVRRAAGQPKYQQIAGGSSRGMYGADLLEGAEIALICEGEFDALLVNQEADGLVTAVTLGSAANRLDARWYAELSGCKRILVAYDSDAAGRRGAAQLTAISPRFQAISLPSGNDITDFYLSGGDIYEWLEGEIDRLNDAMGKGQGL